MYTLFNLFVHFRGMAGLPEPITSPSIDYSGIFINNEWMKSESGNTFSTVNPATGKVIRRKG